jgi:hypothetical protein
MDERRQKELLKQLLQLEVLAKSVNWTHKERSQMVRDGLVESVYNLKVSDAGKSLLGQRKRAQ